jgi:hypothetical protein
MPRGRVTAIGGSMPPPPAPPRSSSAARGPASGPTVSSPLFDFTGNQYGTIFHGLPQALPQYLKLWVIQLHTLIMVNKLMSGHNGPIKVSLIILGQEEL